MRLLHSLLAATALIGLSLTAHANTINLTNVVLGSNGVAVGTVTGTVNFDTSTNLITSFYASVNITADGKSYSFANSNLNSLSSGNGVESTSYTYNAGPGGADQLNLFYQTSGPVLCTVAAPCNASLGPAKSSVTLSNGSFSCGFNGCVLTPAQDDGFYTILSGSLVDPLALPPVASTPEPSSLILLGTGVLGLAGTARRRLMRA